MKYIQKAIVFAALAGAIAVFGGCGSTENQQPVTPAKTVTITDITGRQVEMPAVKEMAIVPLPWASVVYALDGNADRLGAVHPGAMSAYKGHFLEKMDSHFGKLDAKMIGQDFSIHAESLANAGIDSAVLWYYQEKDADKLKQIGIPTVMINNDSVDNLKKSFLIVGQMLGKEDRAKQLNAYYDHAYSEITAHKAEVEKADKPTILFLRNSKLRLQGNDNFIHEAIQIGGGANPFEQEANTGSNKDISMEEVYRINPDIILLSNFDTFIPDDLYENRIPGQDWSTVKAVQNHHVYKVPMGIYRWDAPGVETPLMMKWLATLLQPGIFKDIDVRRDTKAFYKDFMHYDLSDEDLSMIFADKENQNSLW